MASCPVTSPCPGEVPLSQTGTDTSVAHVICYRSPPLSLTPVLPRTERSTLHVLLHSLLRPVRAWISPAPDHGERQTVPVRRQRQRCLLERMLGTRKLRKSLPCAGLGLWETLSRVPSYSVRFTALIWGHAHCLLLTSLTLFDKHLYNDNNV